MKTNLNFCVEKSKIETISEELKEKQDLENKLNGYFASK